MVLIQPDLGTTISIGLIYLGIILISDFNKIWFIEEDVFIPSLKTIENIDLRYQNGDLLVNDNIVIHKRKINWHWKLVNNRIKLKLPYSRAMICAIRCSKKLLLCIDEYVKKYNKLCSNFCLFENKFFNDFCLYTLEVCSEIFSITHK
jgi:hypothetical protein